MENKGNQGGDRGEATSRIISRKSEAEIELTVASRVQLHGASFRTANRSAGTFV